jgi:hypothetical protein
MSDFRVRDWRAPRDETNVRTGKRDVQTKRCIGGRRRRGGDGGRRMCGLAPAENFSESTFRFLADYSPHLVTSHKAFWSHASVFSLSYECK